MADSSAVHASSSPRSRVVRSLARAAERPCSRPGCPAPARATLTFSYATAEALLDRLSDLPDPQRYDLCARHATRTEPPRGWALEDRRPEDDRVDVDLITRPARDLGSDATVAVLAAALRAVPDAPVEDEVRLEVETRVAPDAPVPAPAPAPVIETPVIETPVLRTPRPVPAAGGRGPATDW